jgi:hypothetical protein
VSSVAAASRDPLDDKLARQRQVAAAHDRIAAPHDVLR